MNKNNIIGFVLIGAILIGYSILTKPSKEEIEAAQRKADSIEQARIEEEIAKREAAKGVKHEGDTAIVTDKDATDTKRRNEQASTDTARQKQPQHQGLFAGHQQQEESFITLENNKVEVTLSNKGGRVYAARLKEYVQYDSTPLYLFKGDSSIFNLLLYIKGHLTATQDYYFTPSTERKTLKANEDEQSVNMRLYADSASYIEFIYSLKPDAYMMDFDVNIVNMEEYVKSNQTKIQVDWEAVLPQLEKGKKNENMYSTVYYKIKGEKADKLKSRSNKDREEDITGSVQWIAFKHQFFSAALVADETMKNPYIAYTNFSEENEKYLKYCKAKLNLPFEHKPTEHYGFQFYFGPNHFGTLKGYGKDMKDLVTMGGSIIRWINRYLIIPVFNFLEGFIGSYGIIILLLTIIIKLLLLPLTYRSFKSMAKMKALKPQIEELGKKYPKGKDMEKQKATMDLYKKTGVSPMGGCLPQLLQLPILLAMYRFFPTSIELRQESFLWANDLSTYDAIIEWSGSIPLLGNHISLFTVLMAITTFFSMRMSNTSQPTASNMPNMKIMSYFMPVMLLFILNNFSSGLTYYLFLTNLITLGQNQLFKQFVNEEELLKKLEAKKKNKPAKKSNWQDRLEQAKKKSIEQRTQAKGKRKK